MTLRIPKPPTAGLFKEGSKNLRGVEEALLRNITAVSDLAKILRTSFGPNGRKKIIVNFLEKLFVTSDAATITRELDVVHPAAKLLVMASQSQDQEMGDGTNLVNLLTGELLKCAEDLLRTGLHPAEIVVGYEHALEKCVEIIEELTVCEITDLHNDDALRKAIAPVLASKQLDASAFLLRSITPAILMVMPKCSADFSVDSVRVVKILGGSILSSTVVKGMVFGRESEGSVQNVKDAKVAAFTCPLDLTLTETKGTVLLRSAQELLDFSSGEEGRVEAQLTDIRKAGVTVIVTGSSVGPLFLHFCDRLGIMVVKVPSKFDLRRLCRVTGSTALLKIATPTAEEIGHCDVVETVEIGSDRCTVFRQENDSTRTGTIVLRGATQSVLDDVERAIDDAVNTVKSLTRSGKLLAGAGAVEVELARRLQELSLKTPGLNQYAMAKFGEALEGVPRILAENAGMDATEVLSQLYVAHQAGKATFGVVHDEEDEEKSGVSDAVAAGVYDLQITKIRAIRLAAETVLTILRIDEIIMSKPAGGPKVRENKNWDED